MALQMKCREISAGNEKFKDIYIRRVPFTHLKAKSSIEEFSENIFEERLQYELNIDRDLAPVIFLRPLRKGAK